MQFHGDLINELGHVAMSPAQHICQRSHAEAFEHTGEVLRPLMSA